MANKFPQHNTHKSGVLDGIMLWVGKTKPAELETRHHITSSKTAINEKIMPVLRPEGFTELHLNAWLANPDQIKYLLEHGNNVNAADVKGRTALHIAALRGDKESVEYLLEAGADIAAKDWQGNKPMRYAQGNRQQLLDFFEEIGIQEQAQ